MLELVKQSLRIIGDDYNAELQVHIAAAIADLGVAGVTNVDTADPLIQQAIFTYCKVHMGMPDDAAAKRLQASYDEQKAQLSMHTGHTDWTVS